MPVIIGYLVGMAQIGGGVAIFTGALIRTGTACIMVIMIGAIFMVYIRHGFDVQNSGAKYAFTQLLVQESIKSL